MSCSLLFGRSTPCKDTVGGLDAVYFINDGDLGAITYDSNGDTIATIAGSARVLKYDIKGTSSFTQNVTSSRENGTTYWEQVLELTLPKITAQDLKELKLLAYGNPKVIVKDYNGNFFLMGTEFGADVTGGTVVTGAAMGDMSGFTLTLTGMEKKPANLFDSTTEAALATACGLKIVYGDGTLVS